VYTSLVCCTHQDSWGPSVGGIQGMPDCLTPACTALQGQAAATTNPQLSAFCVPAGTGVYSNLPLTWSVATLGKQASCQLLLLSCSKLCYCPAGPGGV
jgi:hypothetical protein